MILHNLLDLLDHIFFFDSCFANGVEAKILIDPDSTKSFLINCNHIFFNLKRAESIKKSLKTNYGLFENV